MNTEEFFFFSNCHEEHLSLMKYTHIFSKQEKKKGLFEYTDLAFPTQHIQSRRLVITTWKLCVLQEFEHSHLLLDESALVIVWITLRGLY